MTRADSSMAAAPEALPQSRGGPSASSSSPLGGNGDSGGLHAPAAGAPPLPQPPPQPQPPPRALQGGTPLGPATCGQPASKRRRSAPACRAPSPPYARRTAICPSGAGSAAAPTHASYTRHFGRWGGGHSG
nr:uncharacterized protein LOC127340050 [Lolium perenne]